MIKVFLKNKYLGSFDKTQDGMHILKSDEPETTILENLINKYQTEGIKSVGEIIFEQPQKYTDDAFVDNLRIKLGEAGLQTTEEQ